MTTHVVVGMTQTSPSPSHKNAMARVTERMRRAWGGGGGEVLPFGDISISMVSAAELLASRSIKRPLIHH